MYDVRMCIKDNHIQAKCHICVMYYIYSTSRKKRQKKCIRRDTLRYRKLRDSVREGEREREGGGRIDQAHVYLIQIFDSSCIAKCCEYGSVRTRSIIRMHSIVHTLHVIITSNSNGLGLRSLTFRLSLLHFIHIILIILFEAQTKTIARRSLSFYSFQ